MSSVESLASLLQAENKTEKAVSLAELFIALGRSSHSIAEALALAGHLFLHECGVTLDQIALSVPWDDDPALLGVTIQNDRLRGWKSFCPGMDDARYALIQYGVSGVDSGVALVALPHAGITSAPLASIAPEPLFAVEIYVPTDAIVGKFEDGAAEHLGDLAALCLAAHMTGTLQKAMQMAGEHARTRELFGRHLGQFQAIRHICADMAIIHDGARELVKEGFWAALNLDDCALCASQAKGFASAEIPAQCQHAVELLGAEGFMKENALHRLYRSALCAAQLFGTSDYHFIRVADQVLARSGPHRVEHPVLYAYI